MMPVKLGPMFKWFGSKWQSAKHYPRPEHHIVCEPFAGGAGYSLNHYQHQVVLWEDDPNLHQLWSWLISHATEQDILDIPQGLPTGTDIRELGLSDGQALLLKHWQRTNNVGNCWTTSPWGNLPGQWTLNTRARVADQVQHIKHWKIQPPIELIDTPVTWFIDPPYMYNYRYNKSLGEFDFAALDSMVQTIYRGSLVIVCEARCKKTGAIPDYLPFVDHISSVTSRRKATQSHHSSELIYVKKVGA